MITIYDNLTTDFIISCHSISVQHRGGHICCSYLRLPRYARNDREGSHCEARPLFCHCEARHAEAIPRSNPKLKALNSKQILILISKFKIQFSSLQLSAFSYWLTADYWLLFNFCSVILPFDFWVLLLWACHAPLAMTWGLLPNFTSI